MKHWAIFGAVVVAAWIYEQNRGRASSQTVSQCKPSGVFRIGTTSIPAVEPPDTCHQPTIPPHVINSTTGVDITAQHLVDVVPPIGKQPANISAWINVFSSPGVWKWSLISDPSVSFMADISGHRVS